MIPVSWLIERLSLEAIETKLGQRVSHPNWIELKTLTQDGDEFWWFRSPPHTWSCKVGAAGYVLVREGVPIADFTIQRS